MEPTVRSNRDDDNILTISIDVPGKSVNAISPQVIADLSAALDAVDANKPAGVIFTSAKSGSFIPGADLFEIRKMDAGGVRKFLEEGHRLFKRIVALDVPTVAAINGDALGGGLELALACKFRVAVDSPSGNLGLPETKLGILPAWGGTTRLPRVIGLEEALGMILTARTLSPAKAAKAGLVDELAPADQLLAAAKRAAQSNDVARLTTWTERVPAPAPSDRERILTAAEAKTRARSFDQYPAPFKVIEVMRTGYEKGMDAAFAAEVDAMVGLMETPACKNLMRLFFLRQGAKKAVAAQVPAKPAAVASAAVIGGGTMGAGIAYALARSGVNVHLIEVNADAAAAAAARVHAAFAEEVSSTRMSEAAAKEAAGRVTANADWAGLDRVDIAIEAVIERMDLKREVFTKLDAATKRDCVLASNTSSLSVSAMAAMTADPSRVVGLHFFNPVPKMPLVEVVRAPRSSDAALATALGVAMKAGKTPVLVKDAPGFLVNRVLLPYLAEAIRMAAEGAPIAEVDAALRKWGMPMGPFELIDEIGLDVTVLILDTLAGPLGDIAAVPPAIRAAMQNRWLGKKTGIGFYKHQKKAEVNPDMAALLNPSGAALPATEETQWRLVLPMVNEAAKLLAEGVVDSVDTIDLATVLGTGFAPFRGGLAAFADAVGAKELVARMTALTGRYGARFQPAALLVELSKTGGGLARAK